MCRLWLYDYFHVLTGGRASATGLYSKTSVSRVSRAVGSQIREKLPNCSENCCADAQRCCEDALKISPGEKVISLSYSI